MTPSHFENRMYHHFRQDCRAARCKQRTSVIPGWQTELAL